MTQNTRLGLLAAAIVLGVVGAGGLVVAGIWLVAAGAPSKPTGGGSSSSREASPSVGLFGPSASKEGERWNVRELVGYLQAKGIVTDEMEVKYFSLMLVPVAVVTTGNFEKLKLEVMQFETNAKARDLAATHDSSFAWGRFMFKGEKHTIERVKSILG